jgi:hypothetical protein
MVRKFNFEQKVTNQPAAGKIEMNSVLRMVIWREAEDNFVPIEQQSDKRAGRRRKFSNSSTVINMVRE